MDVWYYRSRSYTLKKLHIEVYHKGIVAGMGQSCILIEVVVPRFVIT